MYIHSQPHSSHEVSPQRPLPQILEIGRSDLSKWHCLAGQENLLCRHRHLSGADTEASSTLVMFKLLPINNKNVEVLQTGRPWLSHPPSMQKALLHSINLKFLAGRKVYVFQIKMGNILFLHFIHI